MNSLLNGRLRVTYFFTEGELKSCAEYPARNILEAISRIGNGLQLYRTQGDWREDSTMTVNKSFIYRLRSSDEGAYIDFGLTADGVVMVLILVVNPASQGNGFKLKRFLIHKVAKTLFSAGFVSIMGGASMNDHEVRRHRLKGHKDFRLQRSKDGLNKLVKLYLLLGFEQQGGAGSVILELTKDAFNKLIKRP